MNPVLLLGFNVLLAGSEPITDESAQQQVHELAAWNSRPKVELVGNVGVGHLFRYEDRGFGTRFNAGAGAEATVWRGLRAGAEFNRTFGLDPMPVKCGSISSGPGEPALPCTGSAREGPGAASAASFTVAWYFGNGRVQPYVLGGVSILRTREYTSTSVVHADHVEFRENVSKQTGLGPTFGAGVRACVTRRISIRPEFRFSDGTLLSSGNFSQFRFSMGIAYGW